MTCYRQAGWKAGRTRRAAESWGAGPRPVPSVVSRGSHEASEQSRALAPPAEKALARAAGLQLTVMPRLSPQALLPVLAKRGIVPNLQTFCSLAIGCHRPGDGLQLLADMRVSGPGPRQAPWC